MITTPTFRAVRATLGMSAVLSAAAVAPLCAQTPPPESTPVTIGERFTLRSDVLGEDRPILIGLPDGYHESDEPYPVLYLLDGSAHFAHTTGSARFLAGNNRMPGVIVVAVPNLSGEGRTRNLTPPTDGEGAEEQFPTAGGAETFLRFLTEELRPWVDARYRTRDFEVLVGHSFGGLFIAEVLSRAPSSFDAYIAISPSLWWDDERYVATLADLFERHPDARGSLYMTMGNEGGTMLAGAWAFASTLEKHAPRGFRWHWRHMPTETHGTVPHRTTYDGLEWTFEGWDPMPLVMPLFREGAPTAGTMEALDAHYAGLTERMGWEVRLPLQLFAQMGGFLQGEDRLDEARAVFERAVSQYPDRSASHAGLASALAAACRIDEARTHYAHARERAEAAGEADTVAALDEAVAALAPSSCRRP